MTLLRRLVYLLSKIAEDSMGKGPIKLGLSVEVILDCERIQICSGRLIVLLTLRRALL